MVGQVFDMRLRARVFLVLILLSVNATNTLTLQQALSPKYSVPTAAITRGVACGLVLVLMAFTISYHLIWKPKTSNHDPVIAEEAEPNQFPTSDDEPEKAELDTSEPSVELPDPGNEKREI